MTRFGLVVVVGLMLTGCGGGGGGSVEPSPAPVGEVTLSLASRNFNCTNLIPNTDATVVVHRQDGSVLASYHPDSDGNVTIPWPSEAKHLTLVNQLADEWDIDSWLSVQSGDLGTWVSYIDDLDTGCACKSLEFDVSAISSQFPSHELSIGSSNASDRGAIVPQQVCFNSESSSVVIDLMLSPYGFEEGAFGALLTLTPDVQRYTLVPAMFSNPENVGGLLTVSSNLSDSYQYRTYANSEHGRLFWQSSSSQLFAFTELNDSNLVQGTVSRQYSTSAGEMNYVVNRRVKIEDPDQVQVIFSDNEQVLADRLIETMTAFNEGRTSQYDFSDIGTDRALFFIDTFGTNLNWSIDGPLAGVLPDLSLPADIEAGIEASNPGIYNVILGTSGYMKAGGVQEFRRQLALEIESGSQKRPDYFDNFDMEYLSINLN